MGNLFSSVDSFCTGIFSNAELIKRENPFQRIAERDRWKQEGLFSFPAWKSHYSSSPLCLKRHPPPLPYFTFLAPASLHHKPSLDDSMTSTSFSSIAPPPFSHWLLHCLIPTTAPSFPVSSPLLFLCCLSSLLVVHTNQLKAKEPLCPSHTDWALNLEKKKKREIVHQRKLLVKSKGTETTSSLMFCLQMCLQIHWIIWFVAEFACVRLHLSLNQTVHVCISARKRKFAVLHSCEGNTCILLSECSVSECDRNI